MNNIGISIRELSFTFLISFIYINGFSSNLDQEDDNLINYKRALSISNQYPDSSILIIQNCQEVFLEQRDTVNAIESLLALSDLNKIHLRYTNAFDFAWEALLLAEEKGDKLYLAKSYEYIGLLYYYFNREDESKGYLLKSLNYYKGLNDPNAIISSYYNLALQANWFNDFANSRQYLDSCYIYYEQIPVDLIRKGYLDTEYADILAKQSESQKALQLLLEVKKNFEVLSNSKSAISNDLGYLAIVYSRIADTYKSLNSYNKSLLYNTKSLETIDLYKAHLGHRSYVLNEISDIQFRLGRYKEAYINLIDSKTYNEKYLVSKNYKNADLFEIKNRYREELDLKNDEIINQKLIMANQAKILYQFRILAFSFLFLFVVIVLLIWNRMQKRAHIKEKIFIEQRVIKEQKEHLTQIEQKNKELTSYTLKLIEKDELITQLQEHIKKSPNSDPDAKSLVKSINKNSGAIWEEFNQRFVSVNEGFYERLREKFPKLSPTDLKHCALIKLNFTGKEMAHLLGISTSSVHMSRHRLRKKMELDRDVNLSTFIASI